MNGNGSVIVGQANDATTLRSFRWSAATGMQALPAAPGFDFTYGASSVSADGSVIVGTNANQSGVSAADRAYRCTSAGGYQDLGVQPGFFRSAAINVSGDGLTVVGLSQSFPAFGTVTGAFRWTQSTGLVPLFFDDEAELLCQRRELRRLPDRRSERCARPAPARSCGPPHSAALI